MEARQGGKCRSSSCDRATRSRLPIIMSAGLENKTDNTKTARLVVVSDDEDDQNIQEDPVAAEDLLVQYPDDSEAGTAITRMF